MSEYPEDIMKAAEDLFERKAEQMESIKGCIALLCEAILAERQRCAATGYDAAGKSLFEGLNAYVPDRVHDAIMKGGAA